MSMEKLLGPSSGMTVIPSVSLISHKQGLHRAPLGCLPSSSKVVTIAVHSQDAVLGLNVQDGSRILWKAEVQYIA